MGCWNSCLTFQFYMLLHLLGHQHIGMGGCDIFFFLYLLFEVVDYNSDLVLLIDILFPS